MKTLKILLSFIAFILVLLIAAIIIIPQVIDPNDYKEEMTKIVKQRSGLDLNIEGDLSLSVFPWLGVQTGTISLDQPDGFGDTSLMTITEANIKVKVLPLLKRNVHIDTIILKQPNIQLITNTQGLSNIEAIVNTLSSQSETEQTSNADKANKVSTPSAAIAALAIAGIDISDGSISFDDQQTQTQQHISQLNINSGDILNNNAAPLSITGQFNRTDANNITESIIVSLNTHIDFNRHQLDGSLKRTHFSLQHVNSQSTIEGQLDKLSFSQQEHTVAAEALDVSIKSQTISGKAQIPEVTINLQQHIAMAPQWSANIADVSLSGALKVKNWHKMLIAQGKITSNTFNPSKLLEELAIDYTPANSSSGKKLSFNTDFNGTQNGLSLKNIQVNLDQSIIQGNISIIDFEQAQYRFDVSLNQLNVDNYLPKATNRSSAPSATDQPLSLTQTIAAPIGLLEAINANGIFRAKALSANGIKLQNLYVNVASNKTHLTIKPTAKLYDGNFDGTITLKKGSSTSLAVVSQLNQINLKPLLKDADVTDQLSGIGTITTDVVITPHKNKPSTQGTIALSAKNGSIEGIDIKQILDDAQNKIDQFRGKSVVENSQESEDETRFAEMSATLLIDDNKINNNDLSIKAPLFRVGGKGAIDIEEQTLDYLTSITLVNTNTGQGGKNIENLKGLTIPVHFSGLLTEPDYKIDTKALLKANTQDSLNKKKDELKDKLLKKWGLKTNEQESPSAEKTEESTTTDNNLANKENAPSAPEDDRSEKEKLKDDLKRKLLEKLF